jgi:bacteriorhodopsin
MWTNPWIWAAVTLASLALCTLLPIRIKHPTLRRLAYLLILIPTSLIIILYVYPVGIELCRRLAIAWK